MDPLQLYGIAATVAAAILAVAFAITAARIVQGPNSLDRLVGMDGLVAMLQSGFALYMAWTLDSSVVNAMLVVALLGFIGTVAVTRFRRRDDQ